MKKNKKQKKFQMSFQKGFTLLETFISVAIFALAATMFLGSFSGFLKNSIVTKKAQRNAESAQYSMNLMAKSIRSSVLADSGSTLFSANSIMMYDASQRFCVQYSYDTGTGILSAATATGADYAACAGATFSTQSPLTALGEISNVTFDYVGTSGSTLGFVMILVEIPGPTATNPYKFQTTVALRQ